MAFIAVSEWSGGKSSAGRSTYSVIADNRLLELSWLIKDIHCYQIRSLRLYKLHWNAAGSGFCLCDNTQHMWLLLCSGLLLDVISVVALYFTIEKDNGISVPCKGNHRDNASKFWIEGCCCCLLGCFPTVEIMFVCACTHIFQIMVNWECLHMQTVADGADLSLFVLL